MDILLTILIFIIFVFAPDSFLPQFIGKLKSALEPLDENQEWRHLSKILGRVERFLYGVFFIFLESQFIAFVGIWWVIKAIGSFNVWQPIYKDNQFDVTATVSDRSESDRKKEVAYHRRRANFMIFVIGTGISLIWVIIIGLLFKYYLSIT